MSSTVLHFVLLVTLVTVLQIGRSLALSIETEPEPFNKLFNKELYITCAPDGPTSLAKLIHTIQLLKEAKTIAVLRQNGINMGPGSNPKMQADGKIETKARDSFLTVTVKNPDKDDAGTYTCRMYYEDLDFELKEEKSSTNVTIDGKDMTAIETFLFQKVLHLEAELKQQKEINSQHDKALKEQNDITSQQNNALKEQVTLFKEKVSHLENYTNHLEKTIKDQETQNVDQAEKVSSRIDELEDIVVNRSHVIQGLVDRDSFLSAFSVHGTKDSFNSGETLVFKNFIMNIGNHYDLKTGVFTTPKDGLYVFHLFVWIYKNDNIAVHLKVNDVIVAQLYALDKEYWDQASISTVVHLKEGDRVWPYVRYGAKLAYPNDKNTVFNGYLLKLV